MSQDILALQRAIVAGKFIDLQEIHWAIGRHCTLGQWAGISLCDALASVAGTSNHVACPPVRGPFQPISRL